MFEAYLDHHVHSRSSWDSESTLEDLVAQARAAGVGGFVLTEHIEFDPSEMGFGHFQWTAAREAWEESSALAPDLRIRFGAEVSHEPGRRATVRDFLRANRFHYVIGSVHHVGREEVSNFMAGVEGRKIPLEECLGPYFDACLDAVESNLYDALGHLDFPKRYSRKGPRYTGEFWLAHYGKRIRQILTACLDMGVHLEVNTASFRKGFTEPFPGWAILDLYRELGGSQVVLSSDAHRPEDLATAFSAVLKELSRRCLSVRNAVA